MKRSYNEWGETYLKKTWILHREFITVVRYFGEYRIYLYDQKLERKF